MPSSDHHPTPLGAIEITLFLRTFTPDLEHIKPVFLQAGIFNYGRLLALAKWPEHQIRAFLLSLGLKAVVAEALVVRFAVCRCICGSCADLLPLKRTCSPDAVAVIASVPAD
ncbi:hypothetical protein K438DRAFT_1846135 [Mycena galopus ATCC 62051]|nr:hypothetical protein K438DRAFT_1854699 [Mycena galopus ATCC 62051]KAF8176814.1 hypothetical protein K438DRAFT_1846135 [Mycena galopus ATCC 62051]